jgi:NAD(P)-dependent dehydrogenase (short-subunit alcohol dehydrogenase family)
VGVVISSQFIAEFSTPMALESLKDPKIRNAALATTPMKKIATPEDITGSIAFLSSYKLSGHITGEVITM